MCVNMSSSVCGMLFLSVRLNAVKNDSVGDGGSRVLRYQQNRIGVPYLARRVTFHVSEPYYRHCLGTQQADYVRF